MIDPHQPTGPAHLRCLRLAIALCALCPAAARSDAPRRGTPHSAPNSVVTVTVQPAATSGNREISVADVAQIDGGTPATRAQIASLDLADTPRAGKSVTISQEVIAFRIQIAGIDLKRFHVQGAPSVAVTALRFEVPEADILAAVRQYLVTRLPANSDDIAIELAQPLRIPVLVTGSPDTVQLDVTIRSTRIPLGMVRADVTVSSDGEKQLDIPVALKIGLYRTAAVATRRMERGQTITAEDVRFERRAVDAAAGYLSEVESPVGSRVRRAITPLQVVTKADVEPPPAESPAVVKQRDIVRLVARVGDLLVTAAGEALQDGRPGQMIRVRNVDSKTIVTGRVVSREEVQVLF